MWGLKLSTYVSSSKSSLASMEMRAILLAVSCGGNIGNERERGGEREGVRERGREREREGERGKVK